MMNNRTVARIVDMMFENTEMTDEVAALHDEVMNNCQERYQDMISAGVYEDDAIAAVVESLKGMEDVIAQYRRKAHRAAPQPAMEYTAPADDADEPVIGARDMVFSPQELHRIDLTLVNEDVELVESDDGMYHVRWECDGEETIACRVENGTLKVERIPGVNHKGKKTTVNINNGHMTINEEDVTFENGGDVMEGVGGMLEGLGRALGSLFGSMKRAFNACDTVTIAIPHGAVPHVKLLTTSGDLEVTGVALADLSIVTTSGDVTVTLGANEHISRMELRSTSGDVEVNAFADSAVIGSTSGDVEVAGRFGKLDVNTISGDIDVCADVECVNFKAISGDAELEFTSDSIRTVTGSTISGDIDVDLPDGVGVIAINTSTRSGDVTTRHATNGVGATVTGSVSTMSGDITIR